MTYDISDDMGWSFDGAESPAVEAPAPEAPAYVPTGDPFNMYSGQVKSIWSQFSTGPDVEQPVFRSFSDAPTTGDGEVKGGPKAVVKDDGLSTLGRMLGFSNTDAGRNAAAAAQTGLIGAAISGLGTGVKGAMESKRAKEKLDSEREVNAAQAAAIRAKTTQNLGSMNIANNTGSGLIFKPAKLVPVQTRTA